MFLTFILQEGGGLLYLCPEECPLGKITLQIIAIAQIFQLEKTIITATAEASYR